MTRRRRHRKKASTGEKVLGFDTSDPKQAEALAEHLAAEYAAGKTMKEALEVPEELLESVYAMAYQKYQRGEHESAANLFRYLLMLEEHSYRYLLGLAACLHGKGEFKEAAPLYLYAHSHEPTDPVPLYHAGDCYLQLEDWEAARAALSMALTLCGDQEHYSELKARAELMLKGLEEKPSPSS